MLLWKKALREAWTGHMQNDRKLTRRIFLMITGLSPQIVTETLFAYYVGLKIDDSIPAEVHLITTREGGDRAQLTLLGPTTAHFDNLVSTYKINHLSFLEENIHVLKNKSGQELEDISTPADNSIAADFICEMTNKFTRDGDTELFVSIAGGRKTMGYYAGYALTLFGRPQDRLSHVLVSEEFENNRDFYFPTIKRQIIYSKKNKPLDTSKAIVTLAQIPFVQLRHELPEDSLLQQVGFQEAVALINVSNEKLVVTLNTSELSLSINTRKVHFEPIDFIFYLWFAEQLRSESGFIQEPHDQEPNPIYAAELVNVMDKFGFEMSANDRTLKALHAGMDRQFFRTKKSRVNGKLERNLGRSLSDKLKIQTFGRRGSSLYGLSLSNEDSVVIIDTE